MRHYLFLTITFILFCSHIFAQNLHLSGIVLDMETKLPVEYANVLILKQDSMFILGCTTNSNGSFAFSEIPDSAKLLKISFVGYNDVICKLDTIINQNNFLIYIQPLLIKLQGVVVSSDVKPFKIKDEKLIFDPLFVSSAHNANEIICQAPGLLSTGTSVTMPGKSSIKILINNKEQKGSLAEIMLLLKSYPAADVQSVEVISSPSTRYTRGQDVGVVNIILKKKPNDFLGGNLSYALLQHTRTNNEVTVGFIVRTKRLTTSLNAVGSFNNYDLKENNTVNFPDFNRIVATDMTRKANDMVLRWNFDYQLGNRWNVGLSAFYALGKMKQSTNQQYRFEPALGHNNDTITGNRTDKQQTPLVSLDLDGKLSEKANVTLNVDYFHKNSPTERQLRDAIDDTELLYSHDDINNDNLTARLNFDWLPTTKLNLNFGVDGFLTNCKSVETADYKDVKVDNSEFFYKENQLDIYGEGRYKFNDKWVLRGSLRYQNLWIDPLSPYDSTVQQRYDKMLCPTVFLSYIITPKQSLRLGFYSNFDKPTITSLNPARLYSGNNTYRLGNPSLKFSRHYVVQISYSFGNFMVQPYLEWLNDHITEISTVQDTVHILTWDNAVDRQSFGTMIYASFSKLKWMRISGSAFVMNDRTTAHHPLLKSSDNSWSFSIYPYIQFYFDNDRKFILSVSGSYQSPQHSVDAKMKAMWTVNSSLSWNVNDHWHLAISGLNLFHSYTRGTLYMGETAAMTFRNRYLYPSVQLAVTYNWGVPMRFSRDRDVLHEMKARTELD